MLAQHPAGVGMLVGGHLLGRADGDDAAAGLAALGPEVDDPVGRLDDFDVVLDHQHGVARRRRSRAAPSSSNWMSAKCRPVVGSSSR